MPKEKFQTGKPEDEVTTNGSSTGTINVEDISDDIAKQLNNEATDTSADANAQITDDISKELEQLAAEASKASTTTDNTDHFSGKSTKTAKSGLDEENLKKKKAEDIQIKKNIGRIKQKSEDYSTNFSTTAKAQIQRLMSSYSYIIGYLNSCNDRIDFNKTSEEKNAQGEVSKYKISLKNYNPTRYNTVLVATPIILLNILNKLDKMNESEQLVAVTEATESLESGNIEYTLDVIPRKTLDNRIKLFYDGYIMEAEDIFQPFYIVTKNSSTKVPTTKAFLKYSPDETDAISREKFKNTGGHPGLYLYVRATSVKPGTKKGGAKDVPNSDVVSGSTKANSGIVIRKSIKSTRPGVLTNGNYIPSQIYGTCDITSKSVSTPNEAVKLTKAYLGNKVVVSNLPKIDSSLTNTQENKVYFIAFDINGANAKYWTPENCEVDSWTGGTLDANNSLQKDRINIKGKSVFVEKTLVSTKSNSNSVNETAKATKLSVVSDEDFNASSADDQATKVPFSTVVNKYGKDIIKAAKTFGLTFDYNTWRSALDKTARNNSIGKTKAAEIYAVGLTDEEIKELYNVEVIG